MKLGKMLLTVVTSVFVLGGSVTMANASSIKKGTPKIIRGIWYTRYHKMKSGKYYRYQIHAKKSVLWVYNMAYNKHKKNPWGSSDQGIDKGLYNFKIGKREYAVIGHPWNDATKYYYDLKVSKNHKKMTVWKAPMSSDHVYYWDTFYKK
ncbi:hypothetical protein DA798_11355 [Lactobacillus sp. PFC-70]|nr:hypothetical protein DA798_11355 [Lactobacillus sp. PFC-70]